MEEVDEKTVEEIIHYVYNGKFTGVKLNVQMLSRLADKYDLQDDGSPLLRDEDQRGC